MANLAFRLLQKNNKNGLKYFYINTPGLLSVPKEYIQNGNYRLYLGSTFFNEDTDTAIENKFLLTNSAYYYLTNKNIIANLRFVPWYNTICNIKKSSDINFKENDIVLDGMYSIPFVSKLNEYNEIFEELGTKYNNIYVDCNYLNYLSENVKYNKSSDISNKVTFVTDNLSHSFNYRNVFVIDLDNVDTIVNLSFLKFAFFGMHLDYINVVWRNTSQFTDDIMSDYISLLTKTEFIKDGNFTKCSIDLNSLSSKIIYWENVSYKILTDISVNYFENCTTVLDICDKIDSVGW